MSDETLRMIFSNSAANQRSSQAAKVTSKQAHNHARGVIRTMNQKVAESAKRSASTDTVGRVNF